jgi:hypothetical protein
MSGKEWVCWNVDHAPPLSPEQKERLRALLAPVRDWA